MPRTIYKTRNGKTVPSVTTINRIGQDPGGLIHWAWQLGVDGQDYRQVRDDAAKAGEIGHILVECAIKKTEPPDDVFPTASLRELGLKAFAAYAQWEQQTNIKWVDSELSLVSEQHRFGGTIDAIGIPNGSNTYVIGDWKTGALRKEHKNQIAAYWKLFEECTGHAVSGAHLCRFNKLTGDFVHAFYSNLDHAWEGFLIKRALYDNMKEEQL